MTRTACTVLRGFCMTRTACTVLRGFCMTRTACTVLHGFCMWNSLHDTNSLHVFLHDTNSLHGFARFSHDMWLNPVPLPCFFPVRPYVGSSWSWRTPRQGGAERAPITVPSGHVPRHRSAKQALAVKVEWLAQRPTSTGSPNGPLVLARPTSFDGSPNLVSLTLVAPMSQKFQSSRGGRTAARFFFANGCEAPAARHSPAAPAQHRSLQPAEPAL